MVSDAASTSRGHVCILPGNVRGKEKFYRAKISLLPAGKQGILPAGVIAMKQSKRCPEARQVLSFCNVSFFKSKTAF